MGASASSAASSLPEDASALLTRFAGRSPVSASDPFWSRLLASHAEPLTAHDPAALDRALRPHCVSLAANDARTGNLAGLLLHASRALRAESRCARRDAADDDPAGAAVPIVAVNATTLAGVVLKHLVERQPAAALRDALNRAAPGDDDDPNAGPGGGGPARGGRRGSSEPSEAAEETPAREFLLAVVETLVAAGGAANKNKNKNKTAAAAAPLVVACCRVLVACAYAPPRREAESVSPLFRALALACGGPSHGFRGADGGERLTPAAALVEAALAVVAERPPAGADPSRAVVAATRPAGRHPRDPLGAASDGKSLAAAAFAFFAADSSRADAGPGAGPHGAKHAGGNALPNPSPAADAFASALLALTLGAPPAEGDATTTGASSSGGAPLERTPTGKNPFLDALDAAEDASEDASASEESKNKRVVPRVDFDALARSLCAGVHRGDDRAAMLLHRLLTAPKPKPSGEAAGSLASGSSSLARRPTSFFSKFALRADSDARAQRALAAALLRAAYEGAPVRGLGGGHVLALAAFLKLSGSPAFAGALFSRDDEEREREREKAPEARRTDASAASASTRRSSGSFGEIAPDVSWYRERQASAFSLGSTALATLAKAARCGADPLASDAGPPPNGNGNGTPSETTSPSSSRSDGSRFRERGEKTLVAALAVAAVANLAPAFEGVAAHAAQRLASLLDALAKRRGKYLKAEAEERIRSRGVLSEEETRRAEAQGDAEGGTTDDGGGGATTLRPPQQSPPLDLDDPPPSAVVGDLAKVLLEGCFAATLRDPARTRKNPEIVYALLRGRDALDHLLEAEANRSADDRDASGEAAASAAETNASSDRFGAAVSEVRAAVRRFDERIDASGVDVARYASADAVMAVIVAVASETTGAEAGEGGRGRDEHARGGGGGGGGAGGASRGGGWSSPSRAAAAEAESSRRVFDVALPAEPGAWMATRAWRLLTSDDPSRGGAGMAWDEWDE